MSLHSDRLTTAGTPVEPVRRYLARLSPSSRRVQAQALASCAERFWGPGRSWRDAPWHRLSLEDLHRLREELPKDLAIATANRHLAAVRSVLRICRRLGWSSLNEEDLAAVPKIGGELPLGGRALCVSEITELIEHAARDDLTGTRDAFTIVVLYGLGLRVSEALGLKRGDLAFDKIRIRGKGMRYRWLPVPRWIRSWFAARLKELPEAPETRLIGLSANGVRRMLLRRSRACELPPCSPHDFRRSCITELLREGTDVFTVARLAGHASLGTTFRYDRRPEETYVAALGRIGIEHEK